MMLSQGKLTKSETFDKIGEYCVVPEPYREFYKAIFEKESITITDVKKKLNIETQPAKSILNLLENEKIVEKRSRGGWNIKRSSALDVSICHKLEELTINQASTKKGAKNQTSDTNDVEPEAQLTSKMVSTPLAFLSESSPDQKNSNKNAKVMNSNRTSAPVPKSLQDKAPKFEDMSAELKKKMSQFEFSSSQDPTADERKKRKMSETIHPIEQTKKHKHQ